jgi:hypothetical protein
MQVSRVFFKVLLGCTALTCIERAHADVITSAFQVDHSVQFATTDFLDAHWASTLTFTIAPNSSGTTDFPLLFWPGNFGITFSSSGKVTLDRSSLPAGTGSDTLKVTASGAGTFQVHETAGPGTLDSGDPLALFVSMITGRQDLLFQAPSSGETIKLPAGIPWTTNIHISGDWSQASDGDVQGTHKLLFLSPLWTITHDFTYDPLTEQTLLSVFNPSYPGSDAGFPNDGPYPTFGLVGPEAVPEPAAFFITSIGLALVCVRSFSRLLRGRVPKDERTNVRVAE